MQNKILKNFQDKWCSPWPFWKSYYRKKRIGSMRLTHKLMFFFTQILLIGGLSRKKRFSTHDFFTWWRPINPSIRLWRSESECFCKWFALFCTFPTFNQNESFDNFFRDSTNAKNPTESPIKTFWKFFRSIVGDFEWLALAWIQKLFNFLIEFAIF